MKDIVYCKNCEIELEANMKVCPLCGTSIEVKDEKYDLTTNPKTVISKNIENQYLTDYNNLNPQEKRKLFWELSGIVILSGIIATLAINLIISNNINWSRYCFAVLVCIFANISLITFLQQRIFILLSGSFIANALLILSIDIFHAGINFSIMLGIPILFSFYLVTTFLIFFAKQAKQKSFNIIALFFIAAGIFCLFIEGIVSYYLTNLVRLHWSVIVLVCTIPVASVLFYIHYRLKKGVNLKRFFHI
jgi:RNA polymerase subunit RPABC4/transcription elongation factor Spt4